ncbi:MAG: amidohydrolase family protein [Planctomycetota bacterium]
MRTRFLAARVLPDARSEFAPGVVDVEGDRILFVGATAAAPDIAAADETIDLGDAVLTPGLVNAHSHLDLTHLRGDVPVGGTFADWARAIGQRRKEGGAPTASAVGPANIREAAAREGISGAIARGTTCFGDIVTPGTFGEIAGLCAETGVRARLFVEAIGFHPGRADEVFERVWQAAEMQALPETVATGISPHAPYTVSRELLRQLVSMADGHGRPVAVHVGETLEELAFLRHGIGPLRDLLREFDADDPDHQAYGDMPTFLAELELNSAALTLVHGNYLRPREAPAGAHVVYCPTAHHFFGHPEHPVLEFVEEGVRVALGSDSAASGDTVDLLSETQHLAKHRADVSAQLAFQMATEWGAAALDFDSGRLERGRLADLAAFTPAAGHEILGLPEAECVLSVVGGNVLHRTA